MSENQLVLPAMQQSVEGLISIKVLNSDGAVIREYPEFTNLIVDLGLDDLFNNVDLSRFLTYIKVGTGTTTPSVLDTTLPGWITSQSTGIRSTNSNITTPPYYGEIVATALFNLGAVSGTLGCIGCSPNSNNQVYAWSRIKDGSNLPTTITILPSEQLQVTYRLRLYAPAATSAGSVVIGGVTYNYNVYAIQYGSNWIGAGSTATQPAQVYPFNFTSYTPPATILNTATIVGLATGGGKNGIGGAYTTGSYTRAYSYSFGTTEANIAGGIKALTVSNSGYTGSPTYHIVFDTAIPKDNTKTFSITIASSLARYP